MSKLAYSPMFSSNKENVNIKVTYSYSDRNSARVLDVFGNTYDFVPDNFIFESREVFEQAASKGGVKLGDSAAYLRVRDRAPKLKLGDLGIVRSFYFRTLNDGADGLRKFSNCAFEVLGYSGINWSLEHTYHIRVSNNNDETAEFENVPESVLIRYDKAGLYRFFRLLTLGMCGYVAFSVLVTLTIGA